MPDHDKGVNTLILKEFLPYRLSVLSNLISRSITERYEKKFKLSTAEWRTIAILGDESELSAAEVVARTAMDKVAISRAVNNLLSQGRLERHFSEHDRRRSVLALSESGREVYEQIVPLALDYESAILAAFSDDERESLDQLLTKLLAVQTQL